MSKSRDREQPPTFNLHSRANGILAIVFSASSAAFAIVADIPGWFVPSPLTDLEHFDLVADFDNDSRALVTTTLSAKRRHLWESCITGHIMDIGMAKAGHIQLDEDVMLSLRF